MITFISEQKDTASGNAWIEVDSMHSDICVFSIGISEANDVEDHATYSCVSLDLYRLYSFTKESKKGDSFTMEWRADDDSHYQGCFIEDLGEEFRIEITETAQSSTRNFDKKYAYSVKRETLVTAADEMNNLYLSINSKAN